MPKAGRWQRRYLYACMPESDCECDAPALRPVHRWIGAVELLADFVTGNHQKGRNGQAVIMHTCTLQRVPLEMEDVDLITNTCGGLGRGEVNGRATQRNNVHNCRGWFGSKSVGKLESNCMHIATHTSACRGRRTCTLILGVMGLTSLHVHTCMCKIACTHATTTHWFARR